MFDIISGIYRTKEHSGTFKTAFILTFFGKTAFVQGLSGNPDIECFIELRDWLKAEGFLELKYYRMKLGQPTLRSYTL